MAMPFISCLKIMLGVVRASTLSIPLMLPWYKLAENGETVTSPLSALRPMFTFCVLTLASLSQPILASPLALSFFSADKSIGVSPVLLAAG